MPKPRPPGRPAPAGAKRDDRSGRPKPRPEADGAKRQAGAAKRHDGAAKRPDGARADPPRGEARSGGARTKAAAPDRRSGSAAMLPETAKAGPSRPAGDRAAARPMVDKGVAKPAFERGPAKPSVERGPAKPAGVARESRPTPGPLGPRIVQERIGVLLETPGWDDYQLLDSGEGAKLERYGALTVVRPEPQAMVPRRLSADRWTEAGAAFTGDVEEEGPGRWRTAAGIGETWEMAVLGVPFVCRLTAFRHVGVFPEQIAHWSFMAERLRAMAAGGERPRLLNLFGYTGIASLVAAAAGAEVTHVDASKKAIAWGRENQALAGLEAAPIRWIVDDAVAFAEREVRRGRLYDGILLDPPRFGRGPDGEVWSLEADLPHLVDLMRQVLAPGPSFLILTAYAIRASFLSIHELAADLLGHRSGVLTSGELVLLETGATGRPGRRLSTSLYTRFEGAQE
ncbi:class I SAM-dependent methyltransferase [Mongoliimonas terrestris]|uniref:class I SAM-dependent methyltransferase n=1 Tax=Mongoliimonas terrestris TaxID=1709001 RepID=UPI001FD8DE97|nr:class I SAM-dependent methyltransferase [Mongoliimonas terrestris]